MRGNSLFHFHLSLIIFTALGQTSSVLVDLLNLNDQIRNKNRGNCEKLSVERGNFLCTEALKSDLCGPVKKHFYWMIKASSSWAKDTILSVRWNKVRKRFCVCDRKSFSARGKNHFVWWRAEEFWQNVYKSKCDYVRMWNSLRLSNLSFAYSFPSW